jgi:hypothetical protein
LFTELSFAMLDVPEDEMFRIERKTIQLPEYAPISHPVFSSTKCSVCGEKVLETHARVQNQMYSVRYDRNVIEADKKGLLVLDYAPHALVVEDIQRIKGEVFG